MAVKRADRNTEACPDAIVVDACGHDQNQNFMAVQNGCIDHLDLKALVRLAVTLAADGPSIHLLWHVAERRHFANFIKVFFGRFVRCYACFGVQGHLFTPLPEAGLCCSAESH